MLQKISLIFYTLKHLKWQQIWHQIYFRVVKVKALKHYVIFNDRIEVDYLNFEALEAVQDSVVFKVKEVCFTFLNLTHTFKGGVDWNFMDHGRLWQYNLQYFDYLKQKNIPTNKKIYLIESIYTHLWSGKLLLEPYPCSLRIMNMIRFLSLEKNKSLTNKFSPYIKAELLFLNQRLEFHILANHLLENLFALYMGACFFKEKKLQQKAVTLLMKEFKEQILKDGAHYEVSPMYHQIIWFRMLELYHYLPKTNDFAMVVKKYAEQLYGFLQNISFNNGEIPHLNDSTKGIAYSSKQLFAYANSLGLQAMHQPLSDSNYRKWCALDWECVMDIGGIQPAYQPGHAHADTFTYCIQYQNKPILVDPGISTYNINPTRLWERSTVAHNTININQENSSKVWSGFRVAQRAKVRVLKETNTEIAVQHNGYKNLGITVFRSFKNNTNSLIVTDEIKGNDTKLLATQKQGNLYFHPEVKITQQSDGSFKVNDVLLLKLTGANSVLIKEYAYSLGYNLTTPSTCITYLVGTSCTVHWEFLGINH